MEYLQTNNRSINGVTKSIFLITNAKPTHDFEKHSYGSPCLRISMCFDGGALHRHCHTRGARRGISLYIYSIYQFINVSIYPYIYDLQCTKTKESLNDSCFLFQGSAAVLRTSIYMYRYLSVANIRMYLLNICVMCRIHSSV